MIGLRSDRYLDAYVSIEKWQEQIFGHDGKILNTTCESQLTALKWNELVPYIKKYKKWPSLQSLVGARAK